MQYLDQKLMQYGNTDIYPFHMPGHKRQELERVNPYKIDITEIDGFDNLHHPEDILLEAQNRAATLYGSRRCFYLVNGSTCGLLAAICGATRKRDRILVARNCHKAVYHALYLNELTAEYIYPVITSNDIQGQITPEQIELALGENPDITAAVITSPTYEGVVSDVAGIAEICHRYQIPLIVDEAHGAHFGFGGGFPQNAIAQGADAVIMSLHKTLPSFTQTALLHLNSEHILEEQVRRYLGIFETSSPSYVFMAGMDACIRLLAEQKESLFKSYRTLLNEFYQEVADLRLLHVLRPEDLSKEEAYALDDSKLIIFTGKTGMTGEELHRILLEKYHLQMEMVSGAYVLGMTSIMDKKEGMERLSVALHEIDDQCREMEEQQREGNLDFIHRMYQPNPREMQIYQAMDLPYREVSFEEAIGEMAAEDVFLYPPGIPMIVPGERITRDFIEKIRECRERKLRVEGIASLSLERINVVYF